MVTFFYFSLPIPWTWFQVVLSVFRWLPKSTLARCARGFILNNDDAHNTPGLKSCRRCIIMRQKPFYILIYIPKPPVAVCKRWERLTGDDTLWKRLDLGLAAVPAGACWVIMHIFTIFLYCQPSQGVLGTVLSRGCSILRLARATMAENIFTSPISNQVWR